MFRECTGECLTRRKLNTYLEDISKELTAKGLNIKNHSFRAGVPTMMGSLGYSDSDMMAAGRWQSRAFMAYTKLPRLNRARFAVELAEKLTKLKCAILNLTVKLNIIFYVIVGKESCFNSNEGHDLTLV